MQPEGRFWGSHYENGHRRVRLGPGVRAVILDLGQEVKPEGTTSGATPMRCRLLWLHGAGEGGNDPAIDRDRILVGGCSNGGYMALNMMLEYPDLFAAGVPICEAYRDSGIPDAQLERVKQLPLWFVYAENDPIVPPEDYAVPTLARLHRMGANVRTSIFPDVHDTSGRYNGPDGKPWQYVGHWSWLYFFNNE